MLGPRLLGDRRVGASHVCIPRGHLFGSQLFHFQARSTLMHPEKQQMATCLALLLT